MTSLKLALLWVSAGVLVVVLGLFSSIAERPASAGTAMAPAAAVDQPMQSKAAGEEICQGGGPLSLAPEAPQDAICGSGFTWTCCPCGGCGCRNQHMSPANFCAC